MMTAESKNIGSCPDCGAEVRFKKTPYMGQTVTCRQCDTLLEVVSRFPVALDWAEVAWEDDEDFEAFESSKTGRRGHGRT